MIKKYSLPQPSFIKKSILCLCLFCGFMCANAQTTPKIEYFPLENIRLLDSPFKQAQELDKQYLLQMEADRLLSPFLREAGLTPKAESYTNWENTGLDGHIGGHYLSALSLMYASTGDEQIKQRLNYMLSELKRVQDANGNGYIGGVPGGEQMWQEIANGNIRASGFDLNGKWVPLYNVHKTYAGLRDAYLYAHSEPAKEMLVKMTDWILNVTSALSDEQMQDMLRSEHGGLNETFADVAVITGNKKYLELAHRFSHNYILNPLLNHEDKLTGLHANTQIPKVLGFKRIADAEGNDEWSEASRFFWETIIEDRSVSIGGNSVGEHFNPTNDFSRMVSSIEGPETCNTYNMLRLTRMLYQTSLSKPYMDYYEKTLYNHILSTQNPEHGGFVYFTQMRPGHYRVYSQPQTSMWCCVGSGIENHAKYGESIYAHTDNDLYVNLFIPSELDWKEKNTKIVQENNFPDEAATRLSIYPKKTTEFTLKLRYPSWVEDGALKISVNGKSYPVSQNNGYVSITRKWKKGDTVVMEMPMRITVEQMPDKSNYYTFFYGPIALAANFGTEDLKGLFADDSRGGHIAHGKQIPLKDMPIVVGEPDKLPSLLTPVAGKSLTFKLTSLYPVDEYKNGFELIPFFRLHQARYILYWPQATAEGVIAIQKQIEIDEQEQIKLNTITIDKVVCGEQQPESDHFIKQENSNTGFSEGLHWREAWGWFSYELKNPDKEAKNLYLKYFNSYWGKNFDVFINNQYVTNIQVGNKNDEETLTATFPIPESEQQKDILSIKFVPKPNSNTARIAEVRILSE